MSWLSVKLGEVATLQRGYDLPERMREPGDVPVVTSSGISGTHDEARADGPGVVTGRYGTLGQVYYIDRAFWPHNTTLFVKDFHGNDRRFIYYLLSSLNLGHHSAVSAVPGVNRNDLHRLPVHLPPLPIQRRIAEILGRLDDKIEFNRRINATLEAMAQALYKHWFVDFGPFQDGDFVESELGPIPEGWEVQPMSNLVNLLSGGTPQTKIAAYWNGEVHWVAAKDVAAASPFIMSTERTITELGVDNSSAKLLPAFTTVLTARGTVGECGLLPWAMAINQSNYGIRGNRKVGNFTAYLLTRNAGDNLRRHAYGTVFDTVTRKTFAAVKLAMPSRGILKTFEAKVERWFLHMLVVQKQNVKLAQVRDYLLPKLLSGKLAVEAAEEIAEEAEPLAVEATLAQPRLPGLG